MTMTGRFVDHRNRILAAVALLLAVVSSPVRPTGAPQTAPSPSFFLRSIANLRIEHGIQFAMSGRPCFREADCIQSDFEDGLDADTEDELTVTSPQASVSFEVLPSPSPEAYFERGSLSLTPVAQPLRC
jgi:hypothetical protein